MRLLEPGLVGSFVKKLNGGGDDPMDCECSGLAISVQVSMNANKSIMEYNKACNIIREIIPVSHGRSLSTLMISPTRRLKTFFTFTGSFIFEIEGFDACDF